jgi:hypothetical protein
MTPGGGAMAAMAAATDKKKQKNSHLQGHAKLANS